MGKRKRGTFTDDFKQEAVRLTETSGRTIAQVSDDLGIGLSTLTRWKRRCREEDGPTDLAVCSHNYMLCLYSKNGGSELGNKCHKSEEIASNLRQVEVLVGLGMARVGAIREIGVTEQT